MKERGALRLAAFGVIAVAAAFGAYHLVAPGARDRGDGAAASASAPPAAPLGRFDHVTQRAIFTGAARVVGVAVDARGDVVVTGVLAGTVDFGGGPLTSAEADDVFVLKLDASGKHLWSKRFGGPGTQAPAAIAVDARGDLVIAGTLDQSTDFGGGTLTSAGMIDVFVLKLTSKGEHVWSKRFGDVTEQEANAVALDAEGNVVLAGSFEGSMDFGGGALTSAGADDVYVAKLDASGKHVWSKRFGDERGQRGRAVAIDAGGGIVIAGRLAGTVDFGGGRLTAVDAEDLYVARFDAAGKYVSARQFRGDKGGFADPRALVAMKGGGVAIAGIARGSVDLGGGPLAAIGETDGFVMALDPGDKTRFARRLGGTGAIEPRSVVAIDDGSFVIAGRIEGSAELGGKPIASTGRDDVLLAALDAKGEVTDARRYGDADRQTATCAAGGAGAFVIGGDFRGGMDLGAGPQKGPGVFVAAFATASRSR